MTSVVENSHRQTQLWNHLRAIARVLSPRAARALFDGLYMFFEYLKQSGADVDVHHIIRRHDTQAGVEIV